MEIIERIVHDLRTMNLRRLQLFVRVADEGGFTAAARALGVPKSAVSSAVARLEEELGARLLHRSSRRVTLTEAGAALHQQARPALRALDEAETAVLEAQTALRGPIRITAPVEVGTRLLEPHLTRFIASHPEVSLDVVLTSRIVDLAAEGFDLAVRGGPVRDPSVVARPLRVEDAGLFAAPSYLARRGQPRRVRDLAGHDCVVHCPIAGRATWALTGPRGPERVEVPARLGADQFAFIVRAVVNGAGIGLLPLFLCDAEVTRGDIVRVLPRHAMRSTRLHLVYPSARHLPRRVAALRDFLLDALRPAK
jgi:DNA-binding transcriptional LysR family regulator